MARKPETVFRVRIAPLLYKLEKTSVFPIDQSAICGDPDFMLCVRGRFVALELKDDGEDPTPLQAHKLRNVKLSGGISIVARPGSWDEIYLFLQKLAKGERK